MVSNLREVEEGLTRDAVHLGVGVAGLVGAMGKRAAEPIDFKICHVV